MMPSESCKKHTGEIMKFLTKYSNIGSLPEEKRKEIARTIQIELLHLTINVGKYWGEHFSKSKNKIAH